jgi:hypothetical protein
VTAAVAAPPAGLTARTGTARQRRPWWIWAGAFAVFAGVLCVRNSFLFTTRLYEMADQAANSILIEQARRFTLLVGNYSRVGFHHPGPAYMYVQAAGESLFYDALHVVPTPWNGQLLAVFLLNSALLAMAVAVVYGWCSGLGWRTGLRGVAAGLALFATFAALHPQALSSDWMPNEYITPFLVFLVAAASVAAGHGRDAWIMTLAGWFLIHGHVCFLFFVPVITAAVLILAAWPHRNRRREALREIGRARYVWMPVGLISGIFALPILLDLILHWPGEFGKYLAYSSGKGHPWHSVVRYVLWSWWSHGPEPVLPLALALSLFGVAALAAWLLTSGPLRRYLSMLLVVAAVATAAMLYYAATGIDTLTSTYIGYFYWAVPAIPVLVTVVAVAVALPGWAGTALAAAGATVAVAAFAVAPFTRTSTLYSDPGQSVSGYATDPRLPAALTLMERRSPHRPLVIHTGPHGAWPSMTGILILAERTGVPACLAGPFWEFMVTSQFICTQSQIDHGANYNLLPLIWPHRHAMIVLRVAWLQPRTGPIGPVPPPLPPAPPGASGISLPGLRDSHPLENVALGRGQANFRAGERVRRHLYFPRAASPVPG